ncbi:cysteine hydrolase family protein [Microbacterium sp. SORGH_AS_0888]|uniref:cysteine hydrolase family protein n=1 Tax=Microbacterium sp. SORGH_AS_0888 TaxID=3041791 RepID=UPI002784FE84|nr:isochorismatase family cysteine hydrolase [Microbacterium sp. SORGH_AS_0888]MDQ1131306.1 nicotinamidase-related amidase [Microbacterium sp. SORGH_AS_0888]
MNASPDALRTRQLSALRARAGRGALLVVDVQRSFADPEFVAPYGLGEDDLARLDAAVARCERLVAEAREIGVPVIWLELESGPGAHWRASSWLTLGDAAAPLINAPCVAGTVGADWYRLSPLAGEKRIRKHRYSGFVGTDLESHLAASGVEWVAVAGLTTECCVAATAFDAFQRDLLVTIPADATTAYEAGLHEATLAALALNVALVVTGDELVGLWRREATA